jgi:hypothetical protein
MTTCNICPSEKCESCSEGNMPIEATPSAKDILIAKLSIKIKELEATNKRYRDFIISENCFACECKGTPECQLDKRWYKGECRAAIALEGK